MTLWQQITWETARASGVVAYILISLSVAVGLAMTQHLQSARWPRMLNAEMHNFLALVGLVFIGIHVLAVLVDPFTHFGLAAVLMPFVSPYRPLWMGLGIAALYLGIAIVISTWLRPRIGYAWWRRIHVLTLLGYIGVTLHGIGSGTDTRTWWGALLYLGSVAGVSALLIRRLLVPATERGRRYPVFAALTGAGLLALALWVALGPAQGDWGARAGGTVAAISATPVTAQGGTTADTAADPYAHGFSDGFTGTLTQSGDTGDITVLLSMQLNAIANGTLAITLHGQENGGGISIDSGTVKLGTATQPDLYGGTVTAISGARTWEMAATARHGATTLALTLHLTFIGDTLSGQVTGATAQ